MKLEIAISQLKNLGYAFQKLYAMDYITYRKKVGDYTIWVWSKGKSIEVDDLHQHTDNVIKFFIKNKNANPEKEYLWIEINEETSEVRFRDASNYWKQLQIPDNPYFSEWREKYLGKDSFDLVVKELSKLTKKKIYA